MSHPQEFQSKKSFFSLMRSPIFLAFVVSAIYWIYLFFSSTTLIRYDSIGYHQLGTLIHEKGWITFFQKGPHREPIYPVIISITIALGKVLSISYLPILKVIQLFILFITQLLALKVLRILKIRDILSSLCILYLGFSPALVNSAFSVYSEIATYPLILIIILISARACQSFQASRKKPAILGFFCGLAFITITFIKGIFEVITPVYLLIFVFFAFRSLIKKNPKLCTNALIFLLTSFITFYIPLNVYKTLNKKYNDHFKLTGRGSWALYGNTARRIEPLTIKKLLSALAYAPGEGVCNKIFDAETCKYWSFYKSDDLGYRKILLLGKQGVPKGEVDQILVDLSMQLVLSNPLQYTLFAGIEGMKMIFWESTKIGFVDYPAPLAALFNFSLFKDGIRLTMSILTFLALLYLLKFVWSDLKRAPPGPDESTTLLFCMLALIFAYVTIHSFFFVLTRYALPIAPLYLIIITFVLEKTASHRK